jgi:hypothetical protein
MTMSRQSAGEGVAARPGAAPKSERRIETSAAMPAGSRAARATSARFF